MNTAIHLTYPFVRGDSGEGVAVYPTYSFANHSCVCNSHTRKHKDLKLELVAQSDIKKGLHSAIHWTKFKLSYGGKNGSKLTCAKKGLEIYLLSLCAIFLLKSFTSTVPEVLKKFEGR
jgi:hypothetical protein